MCLSVPARIVELPGEPPHTRARVEHAGATLVVDVSLIASPAVGDYVLLHAGIAIGRYTPEEARETLAVWDDFQRAQELERRASRPPKQRAPPGEPRASSPEERRASSPEERRASSPGGEDG